MGYQLMDLMEGARNYVVNGCQTKRGEEVIVLTDNKVDPLVSQALAAAAMEVGAKVTVLSMPAPELELPRYFEDDIPRAVKEAVWGADLLIEATSYIAHPNDRWLNEPMMENGLRLLLLMMPAVGHLASEYARFPGEIMLAMINRDFPKVKNGKKMRITDPKGTDLLCDLSDTTEDFLSGGIGMNIIPNTMRKATFFTPGACIGGRFYKNVNGVVYFDLVEVLEQPPARAPKWVVEDTYIVGVENAPAWEEMIQEDRRAALLSEIMWQYNPKMNITVAWPDNESVTRKGGVLHMAIGQPLSRAGGRAEEASTHKHIHTHGAILKPTVEIDGEAIIKNGRIVALDDPKVRRVASKYGDPDKVLAESPIPDHYVAKR